MNRSLYIFLFLFLTNSNGICQGQNQKNTKQIKKERLRQEIRNLEKDQKALRNMIKGIDEFHSINKNFQNHLEKKQQLRATASVKEHTNPILDEVQSISLKIDSLKYRLQNINNEIDNLLKVKKQQNLNQ